MNPGTTHLNRLELLQQPAQRGDGTQPDPGVPVTHPGGQIGCFAHIVNLG